MALIECKFFSEVLGLSTEVTVILPQATHGQIGMEGRVSGGAHPTLYLLHGMSDDHSIWLRRTSIERYAAAYGLAVVMPSVHRSWYVDQIDGYRYGTFVMEELPALMHEFFPLSQRRSDTFVAGLSMGGYGAFKWALQRPGSVAAAASLSGGLDMSARDFSRPEWRRSFGDLERLRADGNDLFERLDPAVKADLPALYQWCGTDDRLYAENVRFRDRCAEVGIPLTYEEGPGGHEWSCWDLMIQRVLEWLPLGPADAAG